MTEPYNRLPVILKTRSSLSAKSVPLQAQPVRIKIIPVIYCMISMLDIKILLERLMLQAKEICPDLILYVLNYLEET